MKYQNNDVLKKMGFLLVYIVLAGCTPVNNTTAFPMGESDVAKTLTTPSNTPKVRIPVATPAPMLMASDISGEVIYSAIDSDTATEQIFLKNLDTDHIIQLTRLGINTNPIWSPDGSQIMFSSWTEKEKYNIYIMNKDGSSKIPIMATSANEREADWSPSGDEAVFVSDKDGNDEIYKINLDTRTVVRLTDTPIYDEAFPHWSPNGNNIAFVSSKDGGPLQVYVMDANGSNVKQVTNSHEDDLDRDPIWCPDGSCIIFTRLLSSKLIVLDLNTGDTAPLLGDIFKSKDETSINEEGFPARSPVRGYVTFAIYGKFNDSIFYAMNMATRKIYPLKVQARSLSLYP
jgi:Tol biopolymer transport system component